MFCIPFDNTLKIEMEYEMKDLALVDDMLLRVHGARLRDLLLDFKSLSVLPDASSLATASVAACGKCVTVLAVAQEIQEDLLNNTVCQDLVGV